MVARGKADILCARILERLNPSLCVEAVRVERVSSLLVLLVREFTFTEIPLALSEHTVQSPMEENYEFAICKLMSRL